MPGLEPLLRVETLLLGEAAVVRGDVVGAEPFGQVARHALDHAPRVREHERRVMLQRSSCGELVVDRRPDLAGHDRFERRTRQHETEIALAYVTAVDDLTARRGRGAGQEAGDVLDRLLRRGKTDALQWLRGERVEPLERQREVRTALRSGDRVDLIDDDGARRREHLPAGLAREQQVQRLRRRHEDVRRPLAHRGALGLGRVAGANLGADLERRQVAARQLGADSRERLLEVALDVVRQRLERRDVDDSRHVVELPGHALAHERIDRRQKRGQRLARAGRRSDQRMPAARDRGPRVDLGGGRVQRKRASNHARTAGWKWEVAMG